MFQLLMPAQVFAVLSQLTKVSLSLSVGKLIVTFNVGGTFNPSILYFRWHIHPHLITVGTSNALNIRRHIHPHSIAVGTSVHPHSFSVGTSIIAQSPSANPFTLNTGRHIYLSTLYLSANIFIFNLSLMANNRQKKSRTSRATSFYPYCT